MTNALLEPWTGPFGGVPPFGRVRVADFEPAFDAAMAAKRAEVAVIAGDPTPPTFANVLVALEDAGRLLARVNAVYGVWTSTLSTPELQAVQRALGPRLAAFDDEIVQNEALFARIAAVYAVRERLGPEERRLTEKIHDDFVRAGARLEAASKAKLTALNQALASAYTTFQLNVLADEEAHETALGEEDRAGLPAGFHAVQNTRSSVEPFLTLSPRRDLREQVWRRFVARGANGDASDNRATIASILALRAERAALLGHRSHAAWQLASSMARTPERARALMDRVWIPAVARVREEVNAMRALADHEIAPWDYRFLAEKVRKRDFDFDAEELAPYLDLEPLREGAFWVAGELFGLTFTPREGIEVGHPDIRVFEVTRGDAHVGLFYFDPFARPGKQSGAWMSSYREQERLHGAIMPIVSNNLNLVPGAPLSWADAHTLFHELGHALHGLLSDVRFPSLSGTSVPRDFVEFPSQLLEHWLETPEVLGRFARHRETGAPMPPELVAKLARSSRFNLGFATVEYLAAAFVDMALHDGPPPADPIAVEEATLAALGMPPEIVMRHKTAHFAHLFSGDSYSAAYYAYLWADVLVADAHEAFVVEGGGPFDRAVAARLHEHVLARGDTLGAEASFRGFRGRDADEAALLRKRGFAG